MLLNAKADGRLTNDLTQLIFPHRRPITRATLFSGFVPCQREHVEEFFAASERALIR
jgi:hypothetical protein